MTSSKRDHFITVPQFPHLTVGSLGVCIRYFFLCTKTSLHNRCPDAVCRPCPCQVPRHHLGCCVLPALGSLAECDRGGDWIAGTGSLPFEIHVLEVRSMSVLTAEQPNPGSATGPTVKGLVILSKMTPQSSWWELQGTPARPALCCLLRPLLCNAFKFLQVACFMCSQFRPFQCLSVALAPGLGDRPGPSLLLIHPQPCLQPSTYSHWALQCAQLRGGKGGRCSLWRGERGHTTEQCC